MTSIAMTLAPPGFQPGRGNFVFSQRFILGENNARVTPMTNTHRTLASSRMPWSVLASFYLLALWPLAH